MAYPDDAMAEFRRLYQAEADLMTNRDAGKAFHSAEMEARDYEIELRSLQAQDPPADSLLVTVVTEFAQRRRVRADALRAAVHKHGWATESAR